MSKNKNIFSTKNLVSAALMLALTFLLPFLTGQIPNFGKALLPMHLPVLLCGFVAGPYLALLVGAAAPILRSLIFGMPPLFPIAFIMAFEMAAYGFFAGFLYIKLGKSLKSIYISLVVAMLCGRVVWGLMSFLINTLFMSKPFGIEMFMAGAFINAWPGIVLQLIVIPPIVMALQKANLAFND